MKTLVLLLVSLSLAFTAAAADVLIVADEFPAMELLAAKLKAAENLSSQIVAQTNLPPDLARFAAVIVYIHRDLKEPAERAFIDYTRAGGKLVALHHSISSGKRKNKQWFKFLGVDLPPGDAAQGGYKWIEPVTLDLVNLAPAHFITTHGVTYPARIDLPATAAGAGEKSLPGFTLPKSEVYLNHVLTEPRTVLLGFKYQDAKSGQTYFQKHAGWVRAAGKGWIVYLLPGHSALDFENPAYARIVLNAVVWKP
ncbi:MAG: ThuA domain-containing protein [Verrucomicrobia bacterium]|nr:ThuA domain-containing protein [Verrucomicrobiota bacterium]